MKLTACFISKKHNSTIVKAIFICYMIISLFAIKNSNSLIQKQKNGKTLSKNTLNQNVLNKSKNANHLSASVKHESHYKTDSLSSQETQSSIKSALSNADLEKLEDGKIEGTNNAVSNTSILDDSKEIEDDGVIFTGHGQFVGAVDGEDGFVDGVNGLNPDGDSYQYVDPEDEEGDQEEDGEEVKSEDDEEEFEEVEMEIPTEELADEGGDYVDEPEEEEEEIIEVEENNQNLLSIFDSLGALLPYTLPSQKLQGETINEIISDLTTEIVNQRIPQKSSNEDNYLDGKIVVNVDEKIETINNSQKDVESSRVLLRILNLIKKSNELNQNNIHTNELKNIGLIHLDSKIDCLFESSCDMRHLFAAQTRKLLNKGQMIRKLQEDGDVQEEQPAQEDAEKEAFDWKSKLFGFISFVSNQMKNKNTEESQERRALYLNSEIHNNRSLEDDQEQEEDGSTVNEKSPWQNISDFFSNSKNQISNFFSNLTNKKKEEERSERLLSNKLLTTKRLTEDTNAESDETEHNSEPIEIIIHKIENDYKSLVSELYPGFTDNDLKSTTHKYIKNLKKNLLLLRMKGMKGIKMSTQLLDKLRNHLDSNEISEESIDKYLQDLGNSWNLMAEQNINSSSSDKLKSMAKSVQKLRSKLMANMPEDHSLTGRMESFLNTLELKMKDYSSYLKSESNQAEMKSSVKESITNIIDESINSDKSKNNTIYTLNTIKKALNTKLFKSLNKDNLNYILNNAVENSIQDIDLLNNLKKDSKFYYEKKDLKNISERIKYVVNKLNEDKKKMGVVLQTGILENLLKGMENVVLDMETRENKLDLNAVKNSLSNNLYDAAKAVKDEKVKSEMDNMLTDYIDYSVINKELDLTGVRQSNIYEFLTNDINIDQEVLPTRILFSKANLKFNSVPLSHQEQKSVKLIRALLKEWTLHYNDHQRVKDTFQRVLGILTGNSITNFKLIDKNFKSKSLEKKVETINRNLYEKVKRKLQSDYANKSA